MKEAELYRILMASQAELAPCSSLSSRASQISHLSPAKSKKAQATPWWPDPFGHTVADGVGLPPHCHICFSMNTWSGRFLCLQVHLAYLGLSVRIPPWLTVNGSISLVHRF
jgi:hypothetical protein